MESPLSRSRMHQDHWTWPRKTRQRLGVRRSAPLLEPTTDDLRKILNHSTLLRSQKRRKAAHSKTFGVRTVHGKPSFAYADVLRHEPKLRCESSTLSWGRGLGWGWGEGGLSVRFMESFHVV